MPPQIYISIDRSIANIAIEPRQCEVVGVREFNHYLLYGATYSYYNDFCTTWLCVFFMNPKRNLNNLHSKCDCLYSNGLKERLGFEECNLRVSFIIHFLNVITNITHNIYLHMITNINATTNTNIN